MPLFPDYNALFLHIPKTAGRSIETALLPRGVAATSGRRRRLNRAAHLLQTRTANPTAARHLVGTLDVSLCAQHLTLAEIELLGLIPDRDLAGLLKFCVVRNPFARAISSVMHFRSRFAHRYRLDPTPTPEQLERALEVWAALDPVDHNLRAHRRPQADFLFDRDRAIAVDRVLRFETLHKDFAALAAKIGAPVSALPWIGRSTPARGGYAAFYTPRARRIVAGLYGADLELLGYHFEAGEA